MRKEVIIAIIFGLGLGFAITFGIYRMQQSLRSTSSDTQQAEILKTPASVLAPVNEQSLAVRYPLDGAITAENSTVVTGVSEPNSAVVLLVNNTEYLSNTDAGGDFSFDVPLQAGSNVLTVHVLREDGSTFTDQLTIIMGDYADLIEAHTATESAG